MPIRTCDPQPSSKVGAGVLRGAKLRNRLPLSAAIAAISLSSPAFAQSVPPILITPDVIAPKRQKDDFQLRLPKVQALEAPRIGADLTVTLNDVIVDGQLSEASEETKQIAASIIGRPVSVSQIYAAASEIEAVYARQGFIFIRVTVPPQEVKENGTIRFLITRGFIEKTDVDRLPKRVQDSVANTLRHIQRDSQVKISKIEKALLLANDIPGIKIRSTFMRGEEFSGTQLIIEGSHKSISGEIGIDNQYDNSLGQWGIHASLSLNSLLSAGEQIYGFIATGKDFDRFLSADAPVKVYGGGANFRILGGKITINPEAIYSQTYPKASDGALKTLGKLSRLSVRTTYTIQLRRSFTWRAALSLDRIKEITSAPDFDFEISRDDYGALRANVNLSGFDAGGLSYAASMQLSKGLWSSKSSTFFGPISIEIPYSRQGARGSFTKFNAQVRFNFILKRDFDAAVNLKAQSTLGDPVFRSEQMSLSGADFLSAFRGELSLIDDGLAARIEIGKSFRFREKDESGSLRLYTFSSYGIGRLNNPTALENKQVKATNLGLGINAAFFNKFNATIEFAHGFSGSISANRVNLGASFSF